MLNEDNAYSNALCYSVLKTFYPIEVRFTDTLTHYWFLDKIYIHDVQSIYYEKYGINGLRLCISDHLTVKRAKQCK